jgi:drug/metabolite transporter (DMT)-like permease
MQFPLLRYIVALFLFGSNGVVASHIQADSLTIVFLRTTLGTFGLFFMLVVTGKAKHMFVEPKQMSYLSLSGVFMGLGWVFLYKAYTLIGVGTASLLYYCGPLLLMFISILTGQERYSHQILVAGSLLVLGMVLIKPEGHAYARATEGMAYGLLSAAMYACMVLADRRAGRVSGLANSVWQLLASTVIVTAFLLLKEGAHPAWGFSSWPYILQLGIINTSLGCYLYFSAISVLPIKTVATVGYLEPLSALGFSILFLHEQFSFLRFLGCICILGSVIWTEQQRRTAGCKSSKRDAWATQNKIAGV